jgi:hypothetical protein
LMDSMKRSARATAVATKGNKFLFDFFARIRYTFR